MTDQFDRAQQLEEMQREIALKKHRTFQAVSRLYCEDCDAPIPEMVHLADIQITQMEELPKCAFIKWAI